MPSSSFAETSSVALPAAEQGTVLSLDAGQSLVQHLRADAERRPVLDAVAQHFQEWSSGHTSEAGFRPGRREVLLPAPGGVSGRAGGGGRSAGVCAGS